jgi:hypothetical protein
MPHLQYGLGAISSVQNLHIRSISYSNQGRKCIPEVIRLGKDDVCWHVSIGIESSGISKANYSTCLFQQCLVHPAGKGV